MGDSTRFKAAAATGSTYPRPLKINNRTSNPFLDDRLHSFVTVRHTTPENFKGGD